jgi:hypothetical protein
MSPKEITLAPTSSQSPLLTSPEAASWLRSTPERWSDGAAKEPARRTFVSAATLRTALKICRRGSTDSRASPHDLAEYFSLKVLANYSG